MLAYIPVVFPCIYFMDRVGLKWMILGGSIITSIGSWLKAVSVAPDRFYLVLLGQSIVAVAQVTVLSAPGRIAANWFNSKQVSTATSMGLFGCQLGISLSFLMTPLLVRNHENLVDIGNDMSWFFRGVAIFSTICTFAIFFFFMEEPPLPPSETRALQKMRKEESKDSFFESIKNLLCNRSYLALCNSFGIIIGILNAVSTLLNPMYLIHFKNGEAEAGQIGLAIVITGMFGAIIFGVILDKTKKFKLTITIVYFGATAFLIMFSIFLLLEIKWMVYVSSIVFGFFVSGYFSVGYEVCAEFTYPINEGMSTAILNITNQIYGMIFVLIFSRLMEDYGDLWTHVGLVVVMLVGGVITIFTKDLQNREGANKHVKSTPLKEVIS
ncbi:feline leukemia virus subgroup C receptor-related protein 2 isoform X2 [Cephus cinctus]|nr:feline leukemia virus subgroup C receptor-related protein 2 isoform X2 [Cephus cinctus]XP_024935717.1 feline leukemia virus subgroup C receptor-related protein 2 isoform X2 [Cephus cinctus]